MKEVEVLTLSAEALATMYPTLFLSETIEESCALMMTFITKGGEGRRVSGHVSRFCLE